MENWKAYVSEFIGTFGLIFIGAGSVVADNYTSGGIGLVGIAMAHGLLLAVMISALGRFSGGHFNPAITFGFLVTKKFSFKKMISYWVAQLSGACVAAFILRFLFSMDVWEPVHLGATTLAPDVSILAGIIIELILTFFLVLVVFGTAADLQGPKLIAGFCIGLTLTLGILFGGAFTGGSLNPARSFGPALASWFWEMHLIYWVGPLLGGALAAIVYNSLFLKKLEY